MTPPYPFPEVIDSSFLADFRACGQRGNLKYIQHWKPISEGIDLIAGKAFAAGLETTRRLYYVEGLKDDPDACIAEGLITAIQAYGDAVCPDDSPKTLERVLGALVFYFDSYPLATDHAKPAFIGDRHGIEFSFAEPLPFLHPVTGNPIVYAGRADMIADFADGLYVVDEKTTKQLGPTWVQKWDLRSQFTGYVWAARRVGIPVTGVIVRGVSFLKTRFDTAQAITSRAEWEIDRWLHEVVKNLQSLHRQWSTGDWDFNLDNACNDYNGCTFKNICRAREPDSWLPMYFEQRRWDPLTRLETPLHEVKAA